MSPKQIFSASWKLAAILFCIVSSATAATFENFEYTVVGESVTITAYPLDAIGPVVIPASIDGKTVTAIGNNAFDSCFEVTSIEIPAGVTSIGDFAFSNCAMLATVNIPAGVISIGSNAFAYCTAMTGITIPASVTSIGSQAFYYCPAMTAITVDPANPSYSSAGGILFDKSQGVLIVCPAGKAGSVSIPGTVTSIEKFAFADCVGLTSITIPKSVTSIGGNAFEYCTSLPSITIPHGVTSIGAAAFYNCSGLTSIGIPGSVTQIGTWAFQNCFSLNSATFIGNAPSMGDLVFDNVSTIPAFKISYSADRTGFTSPTWLGYPVIIIPALPVFGSWLVLNGLPAGSDPQSDPNGDGVNLMMAYALNLDPNKNLAGSMPAPQISGNQMSMSLYAASKGVRYTVQSSSDLQNWNTQNVMLSAPGNNLLTAAISLGGPHRFMRLAVSYSAADAASPTPVSVWLTTNGFPSAFDLGTDPNGDGVSLLMAYALDLDPNQNLAGSMPGPVISDNKMSLTFYAARAGVTYVVQSSNDLQNWSTQNVTLSALNGNFLTASISLAGPDRFMRLVVSR